MMEIKLKVRICYVLKYIADIKEIDLAFSLQKHNHLKSKWSIDIPKRSILVLRILLKNIEKININMLLVKNKYVFYDFQQFQQQRRKSTIFDPLEKPSDIEPVEIKSNETLESKNNIKKDSELESDKKQISQSDQNENHNNRSDSNSEMVKNENKKSSSNEKSENKKLSKYLTVLFIFVFLFSLIIIGKWLYNKGIFFFTNFMINY